MSFYLNEDDVCAGFSEGNGDRCSNASCCAGDESSLPFEGEESLCSCHCDECLGERGMSKVFSLRSSVSEVKE